MDTESNLPDIQNVSPKKRVLFVITQSEIGGAQQFLHTFVNHLNKKKYEIMIAAGPSGAGYRLSVIDDKPVAGSQQKKTGDYELLNKLESEGFSVKRLRHLRREIGPIEDTRAIFEIKNLIKEFEPNTLFLLSSKAGFLGSLAAILLIKLRIANSELRTIYRIGGWSFNDPGPAWKRRVWQAIEKLSAPWKDVIAVNSPKDFEQARRFKIRPKEKMVLIHNGLDVYKPEPLPREEARLRLLEQAAKYSGRVFQADTIVGTIANFYPTKDLPNLIRAAEFFKNDDSIIFLIIGEGEYRSEIEKLIAETGLKHKVFLLGRIPEARKYLPAFDIFVLPSLKEGFPWALIEAMAAKLPVISTSVGAVPEIIENGKNGFSVEAGKPDQIANKIKLILSDERLKQELGIQAHQTILFNFSLNKMVEEFESIV